MLRSRDGWLAAAERWLGASTAYAQSATTVCGNAADPAVGVPVTLLQNGAAVDSTVTGADGEFQFTNLAAGDYVIEVTLPGGTISAPAIVQPGQATSLAGELDADCSDVDHDGNRSEPAFHVEIQTEDGSHLEASETEDGGHFAADVHHEDGSIEHQSGSEGDRSDEVDTEDPATHDSSASTGGSSNDSTQNDSPDVSSGDSRDSANDSPDRAS
jgi:hypothetical protein